MSGSRDYALGQDEETGEVLAHKADCPVVRDQARRGLPVITMLDCTGGLPSDVKLHSCLDNQETRGG
jgi:hypothetical protein